jgi:hypothetical protein
MVYEAQHAKGSTTQVPVVQVFEQTPRLNPLAGAASRLAETAKLLVDGQPVTIGITLSITHFWIDRFSEWVRDDPADEIAASLVGESEISSQSDEQPTGSSAQGPPVEREGGPSNIGAEDL